MVLSCDPYLGSSYSEHQEKPAIFVRNSIRCLSPCLYWPFKIKQTQEQEKQQPLHLWNTKSSSSSSSSLTPIPTKNLGPKSGGVEKKLGGAVMKGVSVNV